MNVSVTDWRQASLGTSRLRVACGRSRRVASCLSVLLMATSCGHPIASGMQAGRPPAESTPPHVATQGPRAFATPAVPGENGMVVTDAPLASRVGVETLRSGGTAVDAAVATAFALAVVLPSAGNVGGGCFVVLHVKNETAALDCRETAPASAQRDMFLDAEGEATEKSVTGHLAAGVPGSVAGLSELHRRFGSKPWAELLQPAIRLAERGFSVDADFSRSIGYEAERLRRFPASAAAFLPGGAAPKVGSIWKSAELARTLGLIARAGRDGFYKGETADRLVAEMRRGGGIITHADLESYQPKWREPLTFTYRGQRLASMPPPSSGGLTIAMIAQQLEAYDVAKLGRHSTQATHLQAEAMRRAFAVRNEALGDPDFVRVDTARLASKDFARRLQASIALDRATPSSAVARGAATSGDGPHTTHFSVADRFGNVVAMTTTINSGFGSAVTVAEAGFLLNNEMDDFAAKPGAPNQFGLVQGEANAIAPGKRMLSAMAPTIVFDASGAPRLVTGASGGPYIITTVLEIVSDVIDHGVDVAAAMNGARMHHQHLPDEIALERAGFDAATVAALERLGHRVKFFDVPATGWTVAASIERRDGRWIGASDPRIHGLAAGY